MSASALLIVACEERSLLSIVVEWQVLPTFKRDGTKKGIRQSGGSTRGFAKFEDHARWCVSMSLIQKDLR